MNKTSIEWTHRLETGGAAGGFTWNPIRARRLDADGTRTANNKTGERRNVSGTFCTRISPGCAHCYASTINKRFGNGLEFTVPNLEKIEFFIDEKILEEPLRRKKPATIFVGDMFDLFHEAIPVWMIAEVLRVAWKVQWHTFQFLTKRADRMQRVISEMLNRWGESPADMRQNMWFGVSVESQKYADERIPLLLQTPAAVRFLSVEPQLEHIDIRKYLATGLIHLVIDGGESGNNARPLNLAWAESLLEQCKSAGVPFFMKQIGTMPIFSCDGKPHRVGGKGGEMQHWPEHLRVRQFPAEKLVCA
jgi:protein gp37